MIFPATSCKWGLIAACWRVLAPAAPFIIDLFFLASYCVISRVRAICRIKAKRSTRVFTRERYKIKMSVSRNYAWSINQRRGAMFLVKDTSRETVLLIEVDGLYILTLCCMSSFFCQFFEIYPEIG